MQNERLSRRRDQIRAAARRRYAADPEPHRAKGRHNARRQYSKNRDRALEQNRLYVLQNREEVYAARRARRKARGERGRERERERARVWKLANPGRKLEYQHARQARKLSQLGVITRGYRALLHRLQHGRCFHCASLLAADFHVDHLRPLAIGGLHDDGNLALSCPPCNMGRGLVDASPGPLAYSMESA